MRYATPKLIAAAIAATILAAPSIAAPIRGGTLIFARALDSQYLDPVHTAQNADIWISLNLYDTLLMPTADGKSTVPGMAQSNKMSDDGKTLTLVLRPGLKYADGSPVLVSDVKFSLDRARAARITGPSKA